MSLESLGTEDKTAAEDSLAAVFTTLAVLRSSFQSTADGESGRRLVLSSRGVSTGLLPGGFALDFDILQGELRASTVSGRVATMPIDDAVKDYFAGSVSKLLEELGIEPPPTLAGGQSADEYDASIARERFRTIAAVHEVFSRFAARFPSTTPALYVDAPGLGLRLEIRSNGSKLTIGLRTKSSESEPGFYAEVKPTPDGVEAFDYRPSGVFWDEDASQAVLYYRTVAPRTDWKQALTWFLESSVGSVVSAGVWPDDILADAAS